MERFLDGVGCFFCVLNSRYGRGASCSQSEAVSNGHMEQMILYGSYARGDFKPDSDIDVMILLDLDDSALRSCEKKICDVTYDFNQKQQEVPFLYR